MGATNASLGAATGGPGVSRVLLIADDYAMTEGVSRGIEELIAAGCLSGTGAMTTSRHWNSHAPRLAALRNRAALGLHLNLTLGAPLTRMAKFAPGGDLPRIGALTKAAVLGRIDPETRAEIAAEMCAQIAAFTDRTGALPDFVDGHQHVHALPGIREATLSALGAAWASATPAAMPLVRDPADTVARIGARRQHAAKALVLSQLARGFGAAARRAGFPTNDGFAGVSSFAPGDVEADFAAARAAAGRLHLVMCHPGYVDEELARIDPLTLRRRRELELLTHDAVWHETLLHPARATDGTIDWRQLGALGR